MKILLDTNIVLDVLLEREPWFNDSSQVWQACDERKVTGYLLASTLTDIFYVARRLTNKKQAHNAVVTCLTAFEICPLTRNILEEALLLAGSDFEDDVQIVAAVHAGLDAIVTRNTDDFTHAPLSILTPEEFFAYLP